MRASCTFSPAFGSSGLLALFFCIDLANRCKKQKTTGAKSDVRFKCVLRRFTFSVWVWILRHLALKVRSNLQTSSKLQKINPKLIEFKKKAKPDKKTIAFFSFSFRWFLYQNLSSIDRLSIDAFKRCAHKTSRPKNMSFKSQTTTHLFYVRSPAGEQEKKERTKQKKILHAFYLPPSSMSPLVQTGSAM